MKVRILLLGLLFLSLFIERLVVSFPFVFLFTYIIFTISKNFRYCIPAAILSLIGDAIFLYPLGGTLFIVCITNLFVYVYAQYLGSKDALVYVLFGVIGLVSYAIIFGYSLTDLFGWFVVGIVFWICYKLLPKRFSL